MNAKIFEPGQWVWWACFEHTTPVTVPCPVCAGKKEVVLILGCGEACVLPCDYCRKGERYPRGAVDQYQTVARAERVQIKTVTVTQTEAGEKREYHTRERYVANPDDLFTSESEALVRAEEKAEKRRVEQETRAEYIKKDQAKSYSWNAGYHIREVKKARKAIEYHESMARICRARSGTDA